MSYDDELSIPLLEWNLVGADYECANFEEVKNKIAESMSHLDEDVIANRNKSISEYAKKRPKSHNENISKALKQRSRRNSTN